LDLAFLIIYLSNVRTIGNKLALRQFMNAHLDIFIYLFIYLL